MTARLQTWTMRWVHVVDLCVNTKITLSPYLFFQNVCLFTFCTYLFPHDFGTSVYFCHNVLQISFLCFAGAIRNFLEVYTCCTKYHISRLWSVDKISSPCCAQSMSLIFQNEWLLRRFYLCCPLIISCFLCSIFFVKVFCFLFVGCPTIWCLWPVPVTYFSKSWLLDAPWCLHSQYLNFIVHSTLLCGVEIELPTMLMFCGPKQNFFWACAQQSPTTCVWSPSSNFCSSPNYFCSRFNLIFSLFFY